MAFSFRLLKGLGLPWSRGLDGAGISCPVKSIQTTCFLVGEMSILVGGWATPLKNISQLG